MSIYKNKISEADEDKISGGVGEPVPENRDTSDVIDELPWEVVDDAYGHTLGRYATKEEAEKMAAVKQQSSTEIKPSLLSKIRNLKKHHGTFKFGFEHKFHK